MQLQKITRNSDKVQIETEFFTEKGTTEAADQKVTSDSMPQDYSIVILPYMFGVKLRLSTIFNVQFVLQI